jgi:hypothetical protein
VKKPNKSRFAEGPPKPADTRGNLAQPEVAPAASPADRIDGRRLRATGRTVQFATRVHPDWKADLDTLARQTGKLYVELLEDALAALKRELKKGAR